MNMKRVIVALFVVILLAGFVAACAPTPTAAPTAKPAPPTAKPAAPQPTVAPTKSTDAISQVDPSGQTVLFWHVSTKIHEETLKSLVDEFNTTNEWNITVQPEYGGYYPDIRKKILAAIQADSPPDLAISYQNMVAEYAGADAVVDLDPYLKSEKYGLSKDDLNDYFANFFAGDRYPEYNNAMFSFPPNRSMEVMYVNMSMLKDLGFDKPPASWDDFYNICKAAKEQKDLPCYAISPSASTFSAWVWTRGGSVISEDGKSVAFNGKEGLAALEFLKKLVDEGLAYQISESYGDQTDFANQKTLFTFGSTAGLPYYAKAIKGDSDSFAFDWTIAPFPHDTPDPIVDIYGPSVTVFKTTPERQLAAWLFVKWFTEKQQTATWAMDSNYFPVRRSAAESPEMQDYFQKNPLYKKAFDFLPYGRTEPTIAGWQGVRDALGNAIVAVITGEKSPQEALDEAAATAQSALTGEGG